MGWWGAGLQQLNNDEIDIWQPVTGECQPICLSVYTERWMTLQPHIGGNIHSAAMPWEAHHNPSSQCPSPINAAWHVWTELVSSLWHLVKISQTALWATQPIHLKWVMLSIKMNKYCNSRQYFLKANVSSVNTQHHHFQTSSQSL